MIRRPLRLLSLVALLLVLFTAGCGDGITPAAADVNGKRISQDALNAELDAIRANGAYLQFLESQGNQVRGSGQGTFSADFVRRVLTRQIYLELVHQEFVRQKLTIADEERAASEQKVSQEVGGPQVFEEFPTSYQDTLRRRDAEVSAVQLRISNITVDDAAVRKFFDENQELFTQTCASHILFAVVDGSGEVNSEQTEAQAAELLAQAQAAKARLAAGEPFAALAAELSKDLSNKDQGGELGCRPAGDLVPEFETAMDALEPGQVSEPVKTQFGHHLILVTSRGPKPFEDVTDEIRQRMLSEASQGFGIFLSDAINEAKIDVNPRFGAFSKAGGNPSVIAPNAPTTQPIGGAVPPEDTQNPIDLGG